MAPFYKRRFLAKAKSIVRKRKAQNRAKTVVGLRKKVNRIARQVRKIPQSYQLGYALANKFIERDYVAINLNNYTGTQDDIADSFGRTFNPGATPIFGTQAEDLETNRLIDQSLSFQLKVECGAERNNITYTMFLVSLKDNINRRDVFDPDTGDLDLQPSQHYWVSSSQAGTIGMVLLNPKCFKIHKRWQFTIGNNGQALTSSSAVGGITAQKTIKWTVPMRQTISNPLGDVYANVRGLQSGMGSARDPSKQKYLIMFNDDNVADFESQLWNFNAVRTVKVYE